MIPVVGWCCSPSWLECRAAASAWAREGRREADTNWILIAAQRNSGRGLAGPRRENRERMMILEREA